MREVPDEDNPPLIADESAGATTPIISAQDSAEQSGSLTRSSAPDTPSPSVPKPPRKPRHAPGTALRVLGIALLLLVGISTAGAIYGVRQYNALNAAIFEFCGSLETHQYATIYQDLSVRLRAQYTLADFTKVDQTLDQVEGNVVTCGQANKDNVSFNLGNRSITAEATVARDKGATFVGPITFRLESGGWKVDQLGTSLLGVNPDALVVAIRFCDDLAAQNYTAVYALLGHQVQTTTKPADLMLVEQLHDQADGDVTACDVVGIDKGKTSTQTSLTLSITRSALLAVQGTVQLDQESGKWRVAAIAPDVQGRDVTPIIVIDRWCAGIASANYADAYAISTPKLQGLLGEGAFAGVYSGAQGGIKWTKCAPDPTTYFLSPPSATMTGPLSEVAIATGQPTSQQAIFIAAKQGSDWKMDGIIQCGASCQNDI